MIISYIVPDPSDLSLSLSRVSLLFLSATQYISDRSTFLLYTIRRMANNSALAYNYILLVVLIKTAFAKTSRL